MAIYSALINTMVEAARKSTKLLMRDFYEVDTLKDAENLNKFLESAYQRSEKILMYELSKYSINRDESWVIIPVDGKVNFAKAIPFFTVVLSLINHETVLATVVEAPVFNETFWAENNKGAYLQNLSKTYKLKCSSKNNDLLLVNPSFDNLTIKSLTRKLGATSLEIAYVAAGRLDAVIYKKKELLNPSIFSTSLLISESKGKILENEDTFIGSSASSFNLLVENTTVLPKPSI